MAKNKKIPVKLPPFTRQVQLIKSGENSDWSHTLYKIKELHKLGKKGEGVKIAVLDTGLDLSHNSFQSAISEGRLKSVDARKGQNDPTDKNGHGTWCVSRYISDGKDVLGFSPKSSVTSYKVLNNNGSGSLSNVEKGVVDAVDAGHHIISTSLGWGSKVPGFRDIVDYAIERGAIWVSASGNDGTKGDIDYPALYGDVLAIGSHNDKLKRSAFSDFGLDLDIYASGENVLGAYTNNREAYLQGTSMATPSFGALLSLVYHDIVKKYGPINRKVLKQLVTCQ